MDIQGVDVFSGKTIILTIAEGKIQTLSPLSVPDSDLPFVAPGFFDIQLNGFSARDYSAGDLQAEHVKELVDLLCQCGTLHHLATIITSPENTIIRNLGILRKACESSAEMACAIPGFHVEGPFICQKDGPRGAHDRRFIRNPNIREFERWQEAAGGRIRLITLAPELPGAMQLIEHAVARGVQVAIGHSAADGQTIREAVKAGARLSTHLGVGSHQVLPRLKNYIWEQLAHDGLSASIITDGFHLPSSVVKVFARAKELERLILVSDAAPIGGFPTGVHKWGDLDVEVFADGHLGLAGTQTLAGAAHMLDWDVLRFVEATGSSIAQAVRLCTLNPARLLGLEGHLGMLRPGAPANLVLFRYLPGDQRLRFEKVIRLGKNLEMGRKSLQ